ncbi:restriction endonuclease subunit S [Rhodococcus sp. 27YEA15]|uniref:restriction endonuclease subunit S n=1 Tax=Rhodococcus sp. 27YEA15 TaxID=3156259 RepID=UPI003C7C45F6
MGSLGRIFDGPHATPTRLASGTKYFLNISSLSNGRLDLNQSDWIGDADFTQWTRRVQPCESDLLFSYETRLGEAALMPAGVEACLGRRMALLRPDRSVVEPKFLLYAWLSPRFQGEIAQRSIQGATVDRIPLTDLVNWPIYLPPLNTQQAIAEVLGALDDKIAANRRVLLATDQLGRFIAGNATEGASDCSLTSVSELLTRGVAPRYSDTGYRSFKSEVRQKRPYRH